MQNAFIARLLAEAAGAATAPAEAQASVPEPKPDVDPRPPLDPQEEGLGPLNQYGENPEMHDSALFDVVVEVDFYDGRRIRIPQQSTPPGWVSPF